MSLNGENSLNEIAQHFIQHHCQHLSCGTSVTVHHLFLTNRDCESKQQGHDSVYKTHLI